jgi:hypothetical protein
MSAAPAPAQVPQQVIATTDAESPTDVDSADVDGDGDLDVLSASSGDDRIAWYENTEGVLPVEMAGFEAEVDDEAVRLSWQTASEENNAGFEVLLGRGAQATGRLGERANGSRSAS